VKGSAVPSSDTPKSTIAGDVLRIHRLLTRALEVSAAKSAEFARDGYPDPTHRQGLIAYVSALSTLLHAHHLTEDESVFPYMRDLLPDVPYEALTAQHHAMDPVLDRMQSALEGVQRSAQAGPALEALHNALEEMNALWQTHIGLEEAQLSQARIDAVVDDEEQARTSRVFARAGRKHQMGRTPLYWQLPFLIYNLEGADRAWMVGQMPGIVTGMLLPWIWRNKWAPMKSFLLE
jgi:hemerythrin-like domain-containing protein